MAEDLRSSCAGGGRPAAILAAAKRLRPGDIILIEVRYGHPDLGWTSVEWWPTDFDAIRYAVKPAAARLNLSRQARFYDLAAGGGNAHLSAIFPRPSSDVRPSTADRRVPRCCTSESTPTT